MQSLRDRLGQSGILAGTHVNLRDICVSEMLATLGYDFLWIDTEHTALDCGAVLQHLVAAKAGGTPAIVRVPQNDLTFTKKILDMGPDGIVFPMINTLEDANRAMASCIYPPTGNRGFGPMRAMGYGGQDLQDYLGASRSNLCRMIQIETEQAVRNLDQIFSNPWIDAMIIGPMDLSGSVGELGHIDGKKTSELIRIAVQTAKNAEISIGVSLGYTDPDTLQFWADMGMDIISAGVDYLSILRAAQNGLDAIRSLKKGSEKGNGQAL